MIVKKKDHSYTTQKKNIHGKGFVDSLSSTLKNIGSYLYQNKDLVAKPLIGAAGELAAFGLTEFGKKQLLNLIHKKNKTTNTTKTTLSDIPQKDLEVLQNIMSTPNIIGSGIKKI